MFVCVFGFRLIPNIIPCPSNQQDEMDPKWDPFALSETVRSQLRFLNAFGQGVASAGLLGSSGQAEQRLVPAWQVDGTGASLRRAFFFWVSLWSHLANWQLHMCPKYSYVCCKSEWTTKEFLVLTYCNILADDGILAGGSTSTAKKAFCLIWSNPNAYSETCQHCALVTPTFWRGL